MRILLATDADWIVDAVVAALGGDDTSFTVCRDGRDVTRVVAGRTESADEAPFDVAILDLQIGTMGGMATTMALRLDESVGAVPHVPVLMLLDRDADIHLARRSGAEGWLVKPLNALKLYRAAKAVARGEEYHNGVRPAVAQMADSDAGDATENAEDVEVEPGDTPSASDGVEPVTTG